MYRKISWGRGNTIERDLFLFSVLELSDVAIFIRSSDFSMYFFPLTRPGKTGSTASGRGILSMAGLSYGVVRVDTDDKLTSLTLQDVGVVMPGGKLQLYKCNLVVKFSSVVL